MKRSIRVKLILSYLAVALITVLVVSIFIWQTSGNSLMNLVMEQQTALLKESVQAYYTTNGTLDGFYSYFKQTGPVQPGSEETWSSDKPPAPDMHELRAVTGLVDTGYLVVIPTFGYDIGEKIPAEMITNPIEVDVDGKTVAWILPDTSRQFKLSPEERYFRKHSNLAVGLAALAGLLAAVTMGFLLSGRLIRPIQRLSKASQALAHGDLDQQVPVTSEDELGQLTAIFNQMSTDLATVDQERKRLTADISHDLSTPLQVISGYVEMMEDGEAALTPKRLEIIRDEIGHLRRLVGDLSLLAQADGSGLEINAQPIQPGAVMERVYRTYKPIADRQRIKLTLDIPKSTPPILADEGRMLQVLTNLVENAMRYTPPGGIISLSISSGEKIELRVSDNGSGIDPEDLPFVFNRFYRADKARGSETGSVGLGLAICRALVSAQGGVITAQSDGRDRGTTIIISFDPVSDKAT